MKMFGRIKHGGSCYCCCCCCCYVTSVMSDSAQPHRRQPTKLPHPWDSPGKNTGVGCHCLLQEAHSKNLKFHRKHFLVKDSRDKFLTRVISWSLIPWGTVCVAVIASCPCNVYPFFLPNRTSVLSKIQCARVLSQLQSCLILYDPMDCSPPGSSVHGIFQAGILEWFATPSSKGPS